MGRGKEWLDAEKTLQKGKQTQEKTGMLGGKHGMRALLGAEVTE